MPLKKLTQVLMREPILIGLLIVFSGGIWAFTEMADEVMEGDSHELDQRILLMLRSAGDPSDPIGPKWFEELMRDFTALGGVGVVTIIAFISVTFLWVSDNRGLALVLLIALLGGFLLSLGMKSLFDRPRPELVPHGSHVYTRSFPSGHSMMAASIYLTMGALFARFLPSQRMKVFVLAIATLVTLAVGVSRVYLGVHWPSDVLAGWTAGAAWALACWIGARILQVHSKLLEDTSLQELPSD